MICPVCRENYWCYETTCPDCDVEWALPIGAQKLGHPVPLPRGIPLRGSAQWTVLSSRPQRTPAVLDASSDR